MTAHRIPYYSCIPTSIYSFIPPITHTVKAFVPVPWLRGVPAFGHPTPQRRVYDGRQENWVSMPMTSVDGQMMCGVSHLVDSCLSLRHMHTAWTRTQLCWSRSRSTSCAGESEEAKDVWSHRNSRLRNSRGNGGIDGIDVVSISGVSTQHCRHTYSARKGEECRAHE